MPAETRAEENCIVQIHHRRVLNSSTTGLQNGLMTHGRPSQLVQKAMSVFDMPRFL